ncbi:hypothetical protein ACFL6D_03765 [Spirochaetota bacterium]
MIKFTQLINFILLSLIIIASPFLYPYKLNYPQKMKLTEKLESYILDIKLKIGPGFWFYSRPFTDTATLSYNTAVQNIGLYTGLRYKKSSVYQGIDINLISVIDTDLKKNFLKETAVLSGLSQFMVQASYLASYRHYFVTQSGFTGWNYKKLYYGAGPSYFFFNIKERVNIAGITDETLRRCHRFGAMLVFGIQFSFGKTPFTTGLEIRLIDIFSYPEKDESFSDIKFWSDIAYHQQIISFVLNFNYDI